LRPPSVLGRFDGGPRRLTVDIDWKDGKVTNYRVASFEPRNVVIRVNGELKKVKSEKE
jgi:hypothetical protein